MFIKQKHWNQVNRSRTMRSFNLNQCPTLFDESNTMCRNRQVGFAKFVVNNVGKNETFSFFSCCCSGEVRTLVLTARRRGEVAWQTRAEIQKAKSRGKQADRGVSKRADKASRSRKRVQDGGKPSFPRLASPLLSRSIIAASWTLRSVKSKSICSWDTNTVFKRSIGPYR